MFFARTLHSYPTTLRQFEDHIAALEFKSKRNRATACPKQRFQALHPLEQVAARLGLLGFLACQVAANEVSVRASSPLFFICFQPEFAPPLPRRYTRNRCGVLLHSPRISRMRSRWRREIRSCEITTKRAYSLEKPSSQRTAEMSRWFVVRQSAAGWIRSNSLARFSRFSSPPLARLPLFSRSRSRTETEKNCLGACFVRVARLPSPSAFEGAMRSSRGKSDAATWTRFPIQQFHLSRTGFHVGKYRAADSNTVLRSRGSSLHEPQADLRLTHDVRIGSRVPAMIRKSVVFPVPLRPTSRPFRWVQ